MSRSVALLAVVAVSIAFAQDPDSFDVEPPLLVPDRSDASTEPSDANPQDVNLAKLEKAFERAKRNAADAGHLYRIGVISQVDAEQRALRVIRLEAELATMRLEVAKQQAAAVSSVVVNGQPANDERTKADLAQLTQAAQVATAKWQRAELDAAEANLKRQQKLLAVGSARKSDVARAEQKLAELRTQVR
jgi:type IV secretory pathway VirJ component